MIGRIESAFARAEAVKRGVLVPFFTAGFPYKDAALDLVRAAESAGADLIELGMPFSDPLADGPAIQRSSQKALDAGIRLRDILGQVGRIRERSEIPILLMGYWNPIHRYGIEAFARDARATGVDGMILADLLPEEAADWIRISREHELRTVFLVAPTTPEPRIRRIDEVTDGFLYCVSVTGVTGSRGELAPELRSYLRRVKRVATHPFVVGFGISRPEHVRALDGLCDGCVVGSALVEEIEKAGSDDVAGRVEEFLRRLRGEGPR